MKDQKVFIGGWVEAKLKSRFLKELRTLNANGKSRGDGKISQAKFLEMLLSESVTLYKRPRKARARASRSKT